MIFFCLKIFFEGILILKMQISWYSVKRMSTDLQDLFLYETFLYYNPLLLVVISLYISCSSFIVTSTDMRLKISICEDIDGVAMGNKFVGIRSIFSHLCSGFWPWSYSPHTQWNMEGMKFNFRKIMLMFFCSFFLMSDQFYLILWTSVKCATWMTIVVPTSMTAYLYLYSHGEVALAASQPVYIFYSEVFKIQFWKK